MTTQRKRETRLEIGTLLDTLQAVREGDFSARLPTSWSGAGGKVAQAFNEIVAANARFAEELRRVGREVGKDGKTGQRVRLGRARGEWDSMELSVNGLIEDLLWPMNQVTRAIAAVAQGDLRQTVRHEDLLGRPLQGEFLVWATLVNSMIHRLSVFTAEVTRVAREVGIDGKLGGQAEVDGVEGVWKDLTEGVNSMAANLTAQVRNIAEVTIAVANGDLSRKITVDVRGEILQLKEAINTMVDQLRSFAAEVTRVAREVGTEGKLGGQAIVPGVAGTWKDLTDSVNAMATNLTGQVRNIAQVTTAIARGDLTHKITVEVKGELLELKNTINTMVDQLNAFAAQVTRVASEVGTEGRLGGQAEVPGAAGTWRHLTDNVNVMAANLTEQVRGIVKVVTAVASGQLDQKLRVKSKGEVAALAGTINNMIDTLATFADQVTTVAREVGIDGRLGGQANVPGASGIWRDLTNNVNRLAANLTSQVRAIAEVATAVTQGDLTRTIQVDARGEVADLKDNINTMIGNLRLTTERNTEQDWLKTNLARFSSMLQGQRDLRAVGNLILRELVPLVSAHQGVIYQYQDEPEPGLALLAGYGNPPNGYPQRLSLGEGFIGQCAVDRRRILITDPPASGIPVDAALLPLVPRSLVIYPVVFEAQIKAVLGLASLDQFAPGHLAFLEQLVSSIGIVLNSIEATMRTESLLAQSQELARELQLQQKELQQTNEELALKALQLSEQNAEVERKNQEIELARRALEEKAAELALASRYKSDFLANMSHELRTPLNSILILGQQLSENAQGNLTPKQVEFARTIHAAGSDLLTLITDILDLSKVESGTVTLEPVEITFPGLLETAERTFRVEAENRGLWFQVALDPRLAQRAFVTDSKRLLQVLKNLLSNAFKFTERGGVKLRVGIALAGWSPEHAALSSAPEVVAFEVTDTGVGIPFDKQKIIFEAFQQADASMSRRFGGTGLGLAISRELADLLGGEIKLRSAPGEGSTFVLYLPLTLDAHDGEAVEPAADGAGPAPEKDGAPRPRAPERPRALVGDDRARLDPEKPLLLIAANDPPWTGALRETAHAAGFQVLIATNGKQAVELARKHAPTAVVLDLFLPDVLGWTVMNELELDMATRHIPVQVVSAEEGLELHRRRTAYDLLPKSTPAEGVRAALERLLDFARMRRKQVLVVGGDAQRQREICSFLEHEDLTVVAAASGHEALACLAEQPVDCLVLDLRLPGASGFQLLQEVQLARRSRRPPLVALAARELEAEAERWLRQAAAQDLVRRVDSLEQLLDHTALLVHQPVQRLPADKRAVIEKLQRSRTDLSGKRVMIVDNDVRNIFVVSSVLEQYSIQTVAATTGHEALARLQDAPEIDVVLMDIMMPGVDGFETIKAIRRDEKVRHVPIVALTAKAMKGDREKCLIAGASDYLAKPVDTGQLVSTLRSWMN